MESDGLDRRVVYNNGVESKAVFDTGSSYNILDKRTIKKLNIGSKKIEKVDFSARLINNTTVEFKERIQLEVSYENKSHNVEFLIGKNMSEETLIGRKLVNLFDKCNVEEKYKVSMLEPNNFPIECRIDTEKGKIVSWSRPIRSWQDKKEFQNLVEDYERRRIVEQSTLNWLNPVVIQGKKSGKMRFCLDLRRLNDLVVQNEFELLKIQETISNLGNQKYFTTIDLVDGFFHVNLEGLVGKKQLFWIQNTGLYNFVKCLKDTRIALLFFNGDLVLFLKV